LLLEPGASIQIYEQSIIVTKMFKNGAVSQKSEHKNLPHLSNTPMDLPDTRKIA